MLSERFNSLAERLAALKEGKAPALTLFERARAVFTADDGVVDLSALDALDAELERAGVQTTADARLLRELGQAKGRLGALATGLEARAEESVTQVERALAEAERLASRGSLAPGLLTRLAQSFQKLGRVVKVAAVFAGVSPGGFELFSKPRSPRAAPHSARLALVEFLSERAASAVDDSAQKRRDLDLAYELVLRMSHEAKEDRDRLRRLRLDLGAARDRVRSSPSVRTMDDLVRHLRHAARRDPRTAFRSLRALYDRAVEAADVEVAQVAGAALESISPNSDLALRVERDQARRLLGWREGTGEGPETLKPGGKGGVDDRLSDLLAQVAYELDDDRRRALELAAGAGRYFDVEDSLGEELVQAETRATRPVQRRVSYPTQAMTYEFTGNLEEVHNFVVTYPGTLALDLASGRQMVRSFLAEEPPPKVRHIKKTAVRVYVLDASGSMYGARARFRDAILISELNAIRVKARVGAPFDPLYFSYFNDTPTQLTRIDSSEDAVRELSKRFADSPAEGQTDISLALISAFESIGRAHGRDPYLARATVVLITDGEDGVDLELIRKARQPYEGLDIALSFISLGEENPDLKSLIMEQRREGARAFYHHLSDAEIELARTEFDSTWRTLLPSNADVGPEALEKLAPHLEALEAIAARRPVPERPRSAAQFETFFPASRPAPMTAAGPLRERLVDVCEAIAEAASLASTDSRASEAVTLLTHLLQVYALTPQRYLGVLGDEVVFAAVTRVRLVCRPLE